MAMTCLNNRKKDCFIFSTIDELVPQDHKVRELEEAITGILSIQRQDRYIACLADPA